MLDGESFRNGLLKRDVRTLARMISLAENDPREAYKVLAGAAERAGAGGTAGRSAAHVLGVTGPPGVGKSSLVNALLTEFRGEGRTAAVLAVDPSSPYAGGALLGDRIRMNAHAGDPGVYIRSMATRGILGGLSRAAWLAVRVLTVWGFDWIIIETAGVGQSEIDIVDLAETTALVLSPALGDDVQVMKAGIMEVADLFVINKADLPGAERVRNSLTSVLSRSGNGETGRGARGKGAGGHGAPDDGDAVPGAAATPAIFETVATAGRSENGVEKLATWLTRRGAQMHETNRLEALRTRRTRIEVRRLALSLLGAAVDERIRGDAGGHVDPFAEALAIVEEMVKDDVWRAIDVHSD